MKDRSLEVLFHTFEVECENISVYCWSRGSSHRARTSWGKLLNSRDPRGIVFPKFPSPPSRPLPGQWLRSTHGPYHGITQYTAFECCKDSFHDTNLGKMSTLHPTERVTVCRNSVLHLRSLQSGVPNTRRVWSLWHKTLQSRSLRRVRLRLGNERRGDSGWRSGPPFKVVSKRELNICLQVKNDENSMTLVEGCPRKGNYVHKTSSSCRVGPLLVEY